MELRGVCQEGCLFADSQEGSRGESAGCNTESQDTTRNAKLLDDWRKFSLAVPIVKVVCRLEYCGDFNTR